MFIRVFLHAEFLCAMKTVQHPTIFVKNAKKKIENWLVLVISVNFLRFSLKLLSRISEKVIKNVFRWIRRQINKNEQFSNFWEYQLYRKAIAFDKIGGNYVLSANSIKICLLGYFCIHNSYLQWKKFQIIRFSWKMQKKKKKKIENCLVLVIFVNFLRFSLKLLSRISEKVIKNVFRWKRIQIKQNMKFSNFWENQFYRKAIAFDKIRSNYVLSANSTKICLLGYFWMQNSYLLW